MLPNKITHALESLATQLPDDMENRIMQYRVINFETKQGTLFSTVNFPFKVITWYNMLTLSSMSVYRFTANTEKFILKSIK
jgi:hypothetical protein